MLMILEMLILAGGLGVLGLAWRVARALPRSNDDFIFF